MAAATRRDFSRRPTDRAAPSAGFSLTEVLVTLAIVALASSIIVATARPADPLRQEAERLSRTLEQLQGRARITGEPTGLVLDAAEYTSAAWKNGQWSALPAGRHVLRGVVAQSPPPAPRGLGDADAQTLRPQVIFDPLGHSTLPPVELRAGRRTTQVPMPVIRSGG